MMSMIQTAIIAFILIGMMFLFTGDKKEHTTDIAKENVHEKQVETTHLDEKHSLSTASTSNHGELSKEEGLETPPDESSVTEVVKVPTPEATLPKVVESIKPKEVEPVKEVKTELPKVEEVEKVEELKEAKVDLPKVVTPIKVTSTEVVVPEVNITIPSVPEAPVLHIEIPKIPEVNVSSAKPLTVKSMEEFESNSQMLGLLHKEQNLKDDAVNESKALSQKLHNELEKEAGLEAQLAKVNKLAKQGELQARAYEENKKREIQNLENEKKLLKEKLATDSGNQKELESKNSELQGKIDKLLAIAKEGTSKAQKELDALLLEKKSLEENLTKQGDHEKSLALQLAKVNKLAEQGELQARAYEENKKREIETLASENKSLEANLTKTSEHEKALESQLAKVNKLAEQGELQARAYEENKKREIETLEGDKKSLEENLTTLNQENEKLALENDAFQSKIDELLLIGEHEQVLEAQLAKVNKLAEQGELQARAYEENKKREIVSLKTMTKSLEENLSTLSQENEKLSVSNSEFQKKMDTLLSISEEERNEVRKKYDALLSEKKQLEENLTTYSQLEGKLKAIEEKKVSLTQENEVAQTKIANLVLKLKEAADKVTAVTESENQEVQGLLSATKILESDLTAEKEREKNLELENQKLKEELQKIKEMEAEHLAKEKAAAEAKALEEAKQKELEKAEAEKLAQEKVEAERLAKEKAEAEAKALEEAKQKELAEAEKLAKEKAEAERLAKEKAEAEAKALEEAKQKELAAAEKLAQEKAEAERLAKEQAEAQRLADEKALADQLAAAEQKAATKLAKTKLLDTFSLTDVKFRTNSMNLTTQSKKRLDETAATMIQYPQFVYKISGHTDSSGNEAYNVKLSGQRAEKVKTYLVGQGVDVNLLVTEGFGSAQPIASNGTRNGREKNRRVIFEIIE